MANTMVVRTEASRERGGGKLLSSSLPSAVFVIFAKRAFFSQGGEDDSFLR
jgi:hypothetical protein